MLKTDFRQLEQNKKNKGKIDCGHQVRSVVDRHVGQPPQNYRFAAIGSEERIDSAEVLAEALGENSDAEVETTREQMTRRGGDDVAHRAALEFICCRCQ